MSGLSFGFTKTKEQKVLQTAAINDTDKDEKTEPDYLTSYDEAISKQKDKKEELVIPLIQSNQWRRSKRPQEGSEDEHVAKKLRTADIDDKLQGDDARAARELLEEAARLNDDWEERDGSKVPDMTIPILLRNKVPEGFETDDKLDVSLRPEGSKEADYEQVPIEAFGKAMLRGMGWKEGKGLGKDGKLVPPVDAVLRPKGMGLGADRSLVKQLKERKSGKGKDDEELVMKSGAYCLITSGKHANYYGLIEGLDEDNARAFVKLTITGEKISTSQLKLQLVTAKDFKKNSKYINKSKADEYHKETERQLMEKYEKENSKDKRRDRDKSTDEQDRHQEEDRSDKHSHRDEDDRKKSKHRDRERHRSKHSPSKAKEKLEKHKSVNGSSSSSSRSQVWLRPNLRVRIIEKKYRKGKYFKEKVIVEDVISGQDCICKTEDGKLLEGLSQDMLETVVPKSVPAIIMVVSGPHKTKLGEMVHKDKSSYIATIQVLPDRDEVLQLDFDSICDYTGDTQQELDY